MAEYEIVNSELVAINGTKECMTIPCGVTTIGNAVFLDEVGIKKIILPEGVTHIKGSAFASCIYLTEVILPSSLKRIDTEAFYASDIERITLPRGLKYLGWKCFADCRQLAKITYLGTVAEFNKIEKEEPLINYYNATNIVTCSDGEVTLKD